MSYCVYEVEIASTVPGQRICQHVKAASPEQARKKVQAAQGPAAKLLGCKVWRRCTEAEIAELERAK